VDPDSFTIAQNPRNEPHNGLANAGRQLTGEKKSIPSETIKNFHII
jgi:hypothetical protein